jgi:hypothetical protein
MPRKRGVARYLRDAIKADASRRSANPLDRGSAATKVKEGRRRTRRQQCAGKEETGLFDMVKMKAS